MNKIYQESFPRVKNAAKRGIGGFTLIELLVVVLIIGILAAVAVPQYRVAVAKARFAELQQMGAMLRQAEAVYFMANGVYATDFNELSPRPSGTIKGTGNVVTSGKKTCTLSFGPAADGYDYKEFNCKYDPSKGDTPMWVFSYRSGQASCRSYGEDENSVADQVCRSLGAPLLGGNEIYRQYRLN